MAPRTILGVLHEAQIAPYSGEDLVTAVHHLNSVASYAGIHAKREAIHVLVDVAHGISAALAVLAFDHRTAGYGPEIFEPLYGAKAAFAAAAQSCEDADKQITSLLNAKVGDLAASGRQVPHSTELNGGS